MIIPVLLFLVSATTHMAFFGWPKQVVFDEVYFASFVGDYSTGSYYFDIHPPLAKLITKFFGDLVGTTYGVDVGTIGNNLPWEILLLRLLPIFAGILLPIIIYYLARYLKFSKSISILAASLVILENSILVQSRFLLLDSMLLLFGFSSLLLYLMYVRKGGKGFLIASAICAAGAISVKWTGFAYPLLILIAEIVRTKQLRCVMRFFLIYFVIGIALYMSFFAIHFNLLPNSGPGDAFMTPRFQSTLKGNEYYGDPALAPKEFFGKFIELNLGMFEANRTLTASHPYSSSWFTWPLMLRSVFYWQGKALPDGTNSYIYLLGNPFVYLLGTFSIIFLFWKILVRKHRSNIMNFIIVGFLVNFLPFAFIGRVMFLYHYEAALIFSILAFCYILETFVDKEKRERYLWYTLGIALIFFLYFSPLTYGLSLSETALKAHMWLPGWR